MTTCPKCHYRRQASDDRSTYPGICPHCGIAYAKYRPPKPREPSAASLSTASASATASSISSASPTGVLNTAAADTHPEDYESGETQALSLLTRLRETVTYVPERVDPMDFWARAILFAIFLVWGAGFIMAGVSWEKVGGSFLHNANLAFHEFGHVLFSFLGRFMTILGGSLFQVLFPLVFVVAFSVQKHDNFAAAICLWWCGQNFIDVAPYIADAPFRALPLVGGMGEEAHDWGNLLTMTDSMDSAAALANTSFTIGTLVMLLSYAWAGWILRQQYRNRSE